MSISITPELESKLRERAASQGLTVEAYMERLVRAEQESANELETLALQGLNSGEPIQIEPGYWEEKHRRLEQRVKQTQ